MSTYTSTMSKAASLAPPARPETTYRSILDILQEAGDPSCNPRIDTPAFIISQYFAPNRQEQVVTFRELHQEIAGMAGVYRSLGITQGSKVALAETNSKDFFGSYFGGLAVGATMVSINLLALQDESSKTRYLTHMLATPRLHDEDRPGADLYVFGADSMLSKMYGLQKVLKLKKYGPIRNFLIPRIDRFAREEEPRGLDKTLFRVLSKNAKTRKEKIDLQTLFTYLPVHLKVLTPEDKTAMMAKTAPLYQINQTFPAETVAEVLYTSGTSGYPKGVALTHGNLGFTVASLTEGTEDVICDGDVLLMGLPFFHIFGKAVMLAALSRQMEVARHGGSVGVVILPSLSKAIQNLDGVLKTIEDYGVTILPAVPIFLEKLVHYLQLHPQKRPMIASLKTIISGGAALKRETYDTLKEWLPELRIIEGYGSSEGGINLLNKAGVPGHVGFPLPGVETQLVTAEGETEKGELWVRSPGVSQGYVPGTTDSPDLTIAGTDGWFHTGDLVSWHSEYGYKIMGRDSFFIKIDNEKRSPGELEEALKLADSRILDAWVVAHEPGVNEKAVAVILTESAEVSEETLKKSMNQLAKDNLITRWKIPKHILIINQTDIPARFDQPFKREAAYKVVRQFIDEALGGHIVTFHENKEKPRASATEINDPARLAQLIDKYNTP